jgi:ArsR family transcriptional regulator
LKPVSPGGSEAEEELCRLQADFCKRMTHPSRIRMLDCLKSGEKSLNELARLAEVTQANASQHLALLKAGAPVHPP